MADEYHDNISHFEWGNTLVERSIDPIHTECRDRNVGRTGITGNSELYFFGQEVAKDHLAVV